MNLEETRIQPGSQFKYLGGIFTIGAMYDNIDTFYFKDYQENIYEGRISTLKRMVRDGQYHLVKTPAIGGEAVPCTSETPGPEASPKDSELITCEALEKEGWEKLKEDAASFVNGKIGVTFWLPNNEDFLVGCLSERGYMSTYVKGVKSMPDLRTLAKLVNGE